VVNPIPASTVMLLRHATAWEVLMVLRPARGVFGGVWVFPGGVVEPIDHRADVFGFDDPYKAAGLRETAEEVGIFLTDRPVSPLPNTPVFERMGTVGARFDPSRLRYVSTLVTPEGLPRRFDTRFFVGEIRPTDEVTLRDDELDDHVWISPAEALDRSREDGFPIMLPTIAHLQLLAAFEDPRRVQLEERIHIEIVDGTPKVMNREWPP
jgi:8-oxo-dGTP pyrophosphatase MutT (NUDIX family)